MFFDRTLMWSSVATKHLLEARLHLRAAVEAMADMEGLVAEYQRVVQVRDELDSVFMAVEDKTAEVLGRLKNDVAIPSRDRE
jgi:hypothetical protein